MTPAAEGRIRSAMAELTEAIVAALDADSTADAPDRLLSVNEAAAAMGVGRSLIYNELGAGRLRSIKVGKRRLVPASAVGVYAGQGSPEATK